MNKVYRILLFLILFNYSDYQLVSGQSNYDFLFEDADEYSKYRFGNSIGTPLVFDPWSVGMVFSNTGDIYYPMLVNYNIEHSEWEARSKNLIISLDPEYFWCVIIRKEDNPFLEFETGDSLLFVKGMLPKKEKEFAQILYNGHHIKLVKDFQVTKSKQVMTNEGGFTLNRYSKYSNYYIILDTKHEKVKLNVKDLAEVFDDKKREVQEYFKNNNLNPGTEAEWISALDQLEKFIYSNEY